MALKRSSTAVQVKELLLERILDGTYKPGERLIELQIAEELQTSQAPVREALRYLEAMRLVETEPYKGTRVRVVTERELEESSQVRSVLEQLACELAAPKLKGNCAELQAEADKFMNAARKKDFATYSLHDTAFHRLIMHAADNQLLLSIWESVVLESRFLRILAKIGGENLVEFGDAHLVVLEALEKGDGKTASKSMRNLICKFHGLKI